MYMCQHSECPVLMIVHLYGRTDRKRGTSNIAVVGLWEQAPYRVVKPLHPSE
jgi:hypothetical protein